MRKWVKTRAVVGKDFLCRQSPNFKFCRRHVVDKVSNISNAGLLYVNRIWSQIRQPITSSSLIPLESTRGKYTFKIIKNHFQEISSGGDPSKILPRPPQNIMKIGNRPKNTPNFAIILKDFVPFF